MTPKEIDNIIAIVVIFLNILSFCGFYYKIRHDNHKITKNYKVLYGDDEFSSKIKVASYLPAAHCRHTSMHDDVIYMA